MNSSEPKKRQLLCDEIKQYEVNSGLGENELRCLNLKSTVPSPYSTATNQSVSKCGNTFRFRSWGITSAVCIKDIGIVVELSNLPHNEGL